jgi:methionyl aminopeptidase
MRELPRLKTRLEVRGIRKASLPIGELFASLPAFISPGLSLGGLRQYCFDFLNQRGCPPALRGFKGFPEDICISVNNIAAHGISSEGVLCPGDILTIDVTTAVDGWHGDGAWTFAVGDISPRSRRLLRAAWQASCAGIQALKAGGLLEEVGAAVETTAARFGCSVLPFFVGHGIGRDIHEEPKVLHTAGGQLPSPVVPGLVVTVEPILSLGDGRTRLLEDGWSQATCDGTPTAQYEHTVAVFSDHSEVLTMENQELLSLDFPPFV